MNDLLFFKVFRNSYIRLKILNNLSSLKIYNRKIQIHEINEIKKISEYYQSIFINFKSDSKDKDIIEFLESIHSNVRDVQLSTDGYYGLFDLIHHLPTTVTKLLLNKSSVFNYYSKSNVGVDGKSDRKITNTLKKLFNSKSNTTTTALEQSTFKNNPFEFLNLTYLDIGNCSFNCIFKSNTLPMTLKTFKCNLVENKSFNLNCLPVSSITCLDFDHSNIQKFSTDNGNNNFSSFINLKYLNIGGSFKDKIPIGYLPNSLKSLNLPNRFKVIENLTLESFPTSITKLSFHLLKFNCTKKEWDLSSKLFKIPTSILPPSLIKLKLGQNNYIENSNHHLVNFNSLSIDSQYFNRSELPISVTKLKINSSKEFHTNLPTHIKSLSINGNISIGNSNELVNVTQFKVVFGKLNECIHSNMPLKSISDINELGNHDIFNKSLLLSLQTAILSTGYVFDSSAFTLLQILQLNSNFLIDTNLLPPSIHTLIIYYAPNILLPIASNIKSIFIYQSNSGLLKNLKLDSPENFHLFNIFNIVGDNCDIFKKLTNKLLVL